MAADTLEVDVERGDRRLVVLYLIIAAYLCAAVAYALATPMWEAPDEPAHYNYVRYLIEQRALPVLRQGDYNFDYLESIKAARFPPGMSIDAIRYESHQPPLYYLAGAVVAAPFPAPARPIALRLFSVVLGACLVWAVFGTVNVVAPERPAWALGAAAFVATLPMHVALTAAISNDTLAEVIIALVLLELVRRQMAETSGDQSANADVRLGLLLGLGLWTKTTTYVLLPLVVVVLLAPPLWRRLKEGPGADEESMRGSAVSAVRSVGVALLVALPWFIRNLIVYGGTDLLGLARHDSIMGAQPHTAEWLARLGWGGLIREFLTTTFHSFWAQFGWMGVLVDDRIYLALGLLSTVAAIGFVLFCLRDWRSLSSSQKRAMGVLLLSALFTAASYLWYNVQYVQHQGRYLFPALIPLGCFFAIGLWNLLDRSWAWVAAVLAGLATLSLGVEGWTGGHLNRTLVVVGCGCAVAFAVRALLPQTWRGALYTLLFVGLWALDFICLYAFIVPALRV